MIRKLIKVRLGFMVIAFFSLISLIFCCGCLSTVQARASYRSYYNRAYSAYKRANNKYIRLSRSHRLRKYRIYWIKTIRSFEYVYKHYPRSSFAPKALFKAAQLYQELYGYSHKKADLIAAKNLYKRLILKYPRSKLVDNALYNISICEINLKEIRAAKINLKTLIRLYPKSVYAKYAREKIRLLSHRDYAHRYNHDRYKVRHTNTNKEIAPPFYRARTGPKISPNAHPVKIVAIRHWSTADYTRVVLDTTGPVSYHQGFLRAVPRLHLPKRIYLDLTPAILSKSSPELIKIRNGLLRSVRIAQYNHKTVRVVFDLGQFRGTRVFYLDNPFRIVVDVFGEHYASSTPKKICIPPRLKNLEKGKKLSLAQQLGLCVRRIVIDPGHGGKDPGAIGPDGLEEKNVVLKVAKRLAKILRKRLGCQVILTRKRDVFLPLEERTAIANADKADLFISIHANSSPNRYARGVETFFLNFALDKDAMRVAARENATSTKRISDLQNILNDLMRNSKIRESKRLAQYVQEGIIDTLRKRYKGIENLGVKQAPFFVLIGARMPAILTEISFISNRLEERRLENKRYLDLIAQGIANGIIAYVESTENAYILPRNYKKIERRAQR